MQTGHVKWFNSRKGYGFIQPADGGFNVLVQMSAVKDAGLLDLREGQEVKFETVADDRTGEIVAVNLSALAKAPRIMIADASAAGNKWTAVRRLLAGWKTF